MNCLPVRSGHRILCSCPAPRPSRLRGKHASPPVFSGSDMVQYDFPLSRRFMKNPRLQIISPCNFFPVPGHGRRPCSFASRNPLTSLSGPLLALFPAFPPYTDTICGPPATSTGLVLPSIPHNFTARQTGILWTGPFQTCLTS